MTSVDSVDSVDSVPSPEPEPIILPGYYLFSHCHIIITSHNSPDHINCVAIMLSCSIIQLMNEPLLESFFKLRPL